MSYSDNPVADANAQSDADEANEIKREAARPHAIQYLTGGDTELTREAFVEFLADDSHQVRRPLLSKPAGWVLGPVSDAELLCTLLSNNSDAMLSAAARELRARHLASIYTQTAIDHQNDRIVEGM